MTTLVCFILTIIGSLNWFCIGALQYDFIAGLFGSQANLFSRIIYVIIGACSLKIIYEIIKGKGSFKIDLKASRERFLKKQQEKQLTKEQALSNQNLNEQNNQASEQPNLQQNNTAEQNNQNQNSGNNGLNNNNNNNNNNNSH